MGYYTRYTLQCENKDLLESIVKDNDFALESDGSPADCVKWHEHEEDMKNISRQHPNELFTLIGEGE